MKCCTNSNQTFVQSDCVNEKLNEPRRRQDCASLTVNNRMDSDSTLMKTSNKIYTHSNINSAWLCHRIFLVHCLVLIGAQKVKCCVVTIFGP